MKCRKVTIVVLNYINYAETIECVESLFCQDYENYHILIVDNGSENESAEQLKKHFGKEDRVAVIRSRKNYGFAKGNNIGIHYARTRLGAEYVLLLNSDTVVDNPQYLRTLINADESDVGVIGSGIVQSDNMKMKRICRHVFFPNTLFFYLASLCESKNSFRGKEFFEKFLAGKEGAYIIHGCVMLLTPAYFRHYKGLDSRTFLYCEEELLYLRCLSAGLRQKVVEDVSLLHKCGRSTKFLYKYKKQAFLQYMLPSYKFVVWESIKYGYKKHGSRIFGSK